MWRRRPRLRQLQAEIARARADAADLRMRLEQFEIVAAAAGAAQCPVPSAPMPTSLVAAASHATLRDVPVRLDVAGAEVIAVVTGDGDPREWWTAIWGMAGPDYMSETSETTA